MVQNQSRSIVNLIFPDQSNSSRVINPGSEIGKAPLGGNKMAQSFIPLATDRNSLRSDIYPTIENTKIMRKPRLSGIGLSMLNGFSEEQTMFLTSFRGNGGVWMVENDFEIPSSIMFKVYVEDLGAVAVVLGASEKKVDLKIKISSEDGHFISIENGEKILIKYDINSLFDNRLAPGKFRSFWVNFDKNEVVSVGAGAILGESCIISTVVPGLLNITKKIGFQSFDNSIGISQIKIMPPILFSLEPEPKKLQKQKTINLLVDSFSLILLKSDNIDFNFYNKNNNYQFVNFEKESDILSVSFFKDTVSREIDFLERIKISDFGDAKFLVISVVGRSMYLGACDKIFEKVNIVKVFNNKCLEEVNQIEFKYFPNDKESFLAAPLKMQPNFLSGIGTAGRKIQFKGNLTVLKPFEYEFDQKGPSIICYDKINNDSLILGEAPQQGAIYSFKAIIKPSGNLDLTWFLDPVNPKKIGLKFAVGALRFVEGTLNSQADQAADETTAELKMQLAKTSQNLGLALAGASLRIGAGLADAELETFRDSKNFLKLDKMYEEDLLKGSVSSSALVNKKKVDQKIKAVSEIKLESRDKFDNLIGELNQIVDLIDDPYVGSSSVKKAILINLKKLLLFMDKFINETEVLNKFTGQKQRVGTSEISLVVLNLLLKICNNLVLTDKSNFENSVLRNQFFSLLAENSQEFFSRIKLNKEVSVPDTGGLLLLNQKLLPNNTSLFFGLRGLGKISIVFVDEKLKSEVQKDGLSKNSNVLQIEFGSTSTNNLELKTSFNQEAIFTVINKGLGEANSLEFQSYWINLDEGVLSLGYGAFGQNELLNQKINFTSKNILFGISSFAENEIINLTTGLSKKNLSSELLDFIKSLNNKELSTKLFQKINNDSVFNIKNASGTFITKINNFKTSKLNFFVENLAKNINYKIELEVLVDKLNVKIFDLFTQAKTNPIKDMSIVLPAGAIPFWLEIDNRILTIGFSDFWDSKIDLACMLPGVSQIDLTIKMSSENVDLEISPPFILPAKKNIDYQFLSLLSDQKIKIPLSQAEIDKQKNKIIEDEINSTLEEFSKNDPLVKNLSDEDRKIFTDFIKTAIEKDDFDDYMASKLDYDAWDMGGADFISSDVLLHDDLKIDLLDGGVENNNHNPDNNNSHSERGSEQKLAAQGMAGSVVQLKGEAMDLTNIKKAAAFSLKNKKGMTDQEISEEKSKIKGFGFGRDVNTFKREFKQLSGGKNEFSEEVSSEQTMNSKKEYDSSGKATGKTLHQYTVDSDGSTRKIYANVFRETSAQIDDYLKRKKKTDEAEKEKNDAKKLEKEKENLSKNEENSSAAMKPAVVQDFLGKIVRYFKDSRVNEKQPKKDKKYTTKEEEKNKKKDSDNSLNESSEEAKKVKKEKLNNIKEGAKTVATKAGVVSAFGVLNTINPDAAEGGSPSEDEYLDTGQSNDISENDRLSLANNNAGIN